MEHEGLRARRRRLTEDRITEAAYRLFEAASFEAVSVEEIAAAAEVSPRTVYRYFPTKEDLVLANPGGVDAVRSALAQADPQESDVRYLARAMVAGLTARSPEDAARMYRLIERTPALQARVLQVTWGSQPLLVEALMVRGRRTRGAERRARLLAQTVANLVRMAHLDWISAGHRGSVWTLVDEALSILKDALTT